MLKQHSHYVYYDGNKVMARKGNLPPIVAEEALTPQAAHDRVQRIINPQGLKSDDDMFEGEGYNHPTFQAAISENCREYVETAFATISEN
jgi:hypothetical protein